MTPIFISRDIMHTKRSSLSNSFYNDVLLIKFRLDIKQFDIFKKIINSIIFMRIDSSTILNIVLDLVKSKLNSIFFITRHRTPRINVNPKAIYVS